MTGDKQKQAEYHDAMVTMLELIWGEGYMAPGGEGNVRNLIRDLDVRGKHVLDFGCGIGGPAFYLAREHGATVTGIDIEAPLIERAKRRAQQLELEEQVEFTLVKPEPLQFPDQSFDVVLSSGAFTQIDDKAGTYADCLRVLKPGGVLTCYEWMKAPGEYSQDMHYWFKKEGLTYAMETPDRHAELLTATGFTDIEIDDRSGWYRRKVREEYEFIRSGLYPTLVTHIGKDNADHFVENWRAMVVVCENAEMLQVYCRGRRLGKSTLRRPG
jgi:phosphoethanolamine N-methyltransferase